MKTTLVLLYFSVLLLLCCYGVHRAHLVLLCRRHRRRLVDVTRVPDIPGAALPIVTVQLPLYNEATVVDRLIDAASKLDYPRDRLEIQVLDDSTDETRGMAKAAVERYQAQGLDIKYIRRSGREGYKAGALDYGLKQSKGELVAIFDADFIPQHDFLRQIVGHFQDPKVAMVQTRWEHLNRKAGLLTEIQALMLDGHHMVENRARFASGCMFNFSGTGGIWRAVAIHDAGGWQHDTLTEDLDLSYRAQLKGWRFIYRPDVLTPAELPEDISAFRAQQYRWAKGTVQTSRKLLVRVLGAPITFGQKVEACFHLLPHFAYPLMLLLSVLLLPALILMPATDVMTMVIIDLPLCIGATGSLAAFYGMAEVAQGRSLWGAMARLPAIIALGAGLAPHLTKAVFGGLRSMSGEFVRTPKRGDAAGRYKQVAQLPLLEVGLALVSATSVVASIETEHWFATPFALLFAVGYSYVGGMVIIEQLGWRSGAAPASARSPELLGEVEVSRAA